MAHRHMASEAEKKNFFFFEGSGKKKELETIPSSGRAHLTLVLAAHLMLVAAAHRRPNGPHDIRASSPATYHEQRRGKGKREESLS